MAKPEQPGSHEVSADRVDYAIGYAKPPVHSRFAKGRSGNPGGGSAKARAKTVAQADSVFDQIILDEAARSVSITENGQRKQITTLEAIGRSLMIDAVKGNRVAQKLALKTVEAAQDRQRAAATERFGLLVQYHSNQIAIGNASPPPGCGFCWPSPMDVILDYRCCEGRVVGPITAQQAEPLLAIVAEHRLWQARQEHLRSAMAAARGECQTLISLALNAVAGLLDQISVVLPPSLHIELDQAGDDMPTQALVMVDLAGDTIDLAALPTTDAERAHALRRVTTVAVQAARDLPRRARLDISANTISLIHRLQVERRNGEAGLGPAASVPDFADFYGTMERTNSDSDDKVMP